MPQFIPVALFCHNATFHGSGLSPGSFSGHQFLGDSPSGEETGVILTSCWLKNKSVYPAAPYTTDNNDFTTKHEHKLFPTYLFSDYYLSCITLYAYLHFGALWHSGEHMFPFHIVL